MEHINETMSTTLTAVIKSSMVPPAVEIAFPERLPKIAGSVASIARESHANVAVNVERVAGIEPSFSASERGPNHAPGG
jgi:hypothetical protein